MEENRVINHLINEVMENRKLSPEKWVNVIDSDNSWNRLGLRDIMENNNFNQIVKIAEERYGKPIYENGNFANNGLENERTKMILKRKLDYIKLKDSTLVYFKERQNDYRILTIERPEKENFFVTDIHDIGLFDFVMQEELFKKEMDFEEKNKRKSIINYDIRPNDYNKYGKTEHSVLDINNCFSLDGLIKVYKELYLRNKELKNEIIGKQYISKIRDIEKNNSYSFYHTTASVLVTAGFKFTTNLKNNKDYIKFLSSLYDLETGFTHRSFRDTSRKTINLLNKTIIIEYANDERVKLLNKLMIQGTSSNWRGKIQNFSHLVYTLENALKEIPHEQTRLDIGNTPLGLKLLYYETGVGHEGDDLRPTNFIGYIHNLPGSPTRIYAGNELEISYSFK